MQKIFNNFDKSGDKELQFEEMKKMMQIFDKNILDDEVSCIIQFLDKDGNGSVSYEEFYQAIKQQQ